MLGWKITTIECFHTQFSLINVHQLYYFPIYQIRCEINHVVAAMFLYSGESQDHQLPRGVT